MDWEYRLVKKTINNEEFIQIKEVYYEGDKIVLIGDAPIPYGETKEEVAECLELMQRALEKDVLDMPIFNTEQLHENEHVYCTKCANGLSLVNSINNETEPPSDCKECNPNDLEDSVPFKDRPKYKVLK